MREPPAEKTDGKSAADQKVDKKDKKKDAKAKPDGKPAGPTTSRQMPNWHPMMPPAPVDGVQFGWLDEIGMRNGDCE
jgi:hypothetical protein